MMHYKLHSCSNCEMRSETESRQMYRLRQKHCATVSEIKVPARYCQPKKLLDISQGGVATHVRCGKWWLSRNVLMSVTVKEFLGQHVSKCRKYHGNLVFFDPPCPVTPFLHLPVYWIKPVWGVETLTLQWRVTSCIASIVICAKVSTSHRDRLAIHSNSIGQDIQWVTSCLENLKMLGISQLSRKIIVVETVYCQLHI